jgi:uncharacterized protein
MANNIIDLPIKTALITGASEGIGREFAHQLARAGFTITAVARNERRLRELVEELANGDHKIVVSDLSQPAGVENVVSHIRRTHYDLVVNNAGYGVYGIFEDTDLKSLRNMMDVNCTAVLEIAHAYLKTAKRGDALINVSSTASELPMAFAGAYAATKGFVTMLSESIWYEQIKKGVYVMALCPGMTATQFHTRAGGRAGQIPAFFSQTPAQVVGRALKKLRGRRAPVVLCGPQRPLIFMSRFLPRRLVVYLAGRVLEWGFAHK